MATQTGSVRRGSSSRSILARLRRSFLLSFATFGLVLLVVFGPLFEWLGQPTVAGIVAASGLVILVANLIGYAIYRFLRANY